MEGILEKVFRFLFVPESSLSWIFLVIFIIVIGISVYYDSLCRKKITTISNEIIEKYKANSNRYSAKEFLNLEISKNNANEGIMEDIPNLFVSIGILGTFIGLGIAIQGAAELLSTDKVDIARLNDVLGIIAFKFQTSVWGTCFSILYQKIILERYFVWKTKVVDATYDKLVHLEKETTNTLLQQQLTQVTLMQSSMSEFISFGKEFMATAAEFRNDVVKLDGSIIAFKESLIDHLHENTQSLQSHQQAVGDMQQELISNVNRNIDDTRKAFVAEQESVAEKHDEMLVKIHRSVDTLQKVFLRSENEYVQETQNALSKMLADNIDKVNYAYLNKAQKFSDVVNKFDNILEGMNQQVDNMHNEFVEEHKKLVAINNKAYKEVQGTMVQVKEIEEMHQTNVAGLCQKLQKLAQGYTETSNNNISVIQEVVNNQITNMESFKSNLQDNFVNKLINSLAITKSVIEEQGNNSSLVLTDIKNVLENNGQESSKNNIELQTAVESMHNTIKDTQAEQVQCTKNMVLDVAKVISEQTDAEEASLLAIKDLLEKNKSEDVLHNRIVKNLLQDIQIAITNANTIHNEDNSIINKALTSLKDILITKSSEDKNALIAINGLLSDAGKNLISNNRSLEMAIQDVKLVLENDIVSQNKKVEILQNSIDNIESLADNSLKINASTLTEISNSRVESNKLLEKTLTNLSELIKGMRDSRNPAGENLCCNQKLLSESRSSNSVDDDALKQIDDGQEQIRGNK